MESKMLKMEWKSNAEQHEYKTKLVAFYVTKMRRSSKQNQTKMFYQWISSISKLSVNTVWWMILNVMQTYIPLGCLISNILQNSD